MHKVRRKTYFDDGQNKLNSLRKRYYSSKHLSTEKLGVKDAENKVELSNLPLKNDKYNSVLNNIYDPCSNKTTLLNKNSTLNKELKLRRITKSFIAEYISYFYQHLVQRYSEQLLDLVEATYENYIKISKNYRNQIKEIEYYELESNK